MKIKFVSPELANFEGMYGAIEFKEGLSVTDVTEADVRLYGAITLIEVIGDDFTPEKSYDEMKNVFAASVNLPTLADLEAMQPVELAAAPIELVAPAVLYTKEQLEAIADKEGISGIREIGTPLNVRATSIAKLIQEILEAQAPFLPAAEFIEAPAEGVTVTITESIVEGEGA